MLESLFYGICKDVFKLKLIVNIILMVFNLNYFRLNLLLKCNFYF